MRFVFLLRNTPGQLCGSQRQNHGNLLQHKDKNKNKKQYVKQKSSRRT